MFVLSLFGRDPPPLIQTDSNQGYKQLKAKLGRNHVRPWKWMAFTNPARKVSIYQNQNGRLNK